MNKEQFIAHMNKKLAVIKEEERKDIIDEYINHIDMKVQEGVSEEEAIAAFGDIDEMVKEILEAYNIDPQQARSSQDGFDRKVNDFIDHAFDAFQKLLSSFTGMDVDSVVKMIFEILLVLIILAVVHIPFEIVASIGHGILRSLFGYGIGSTFGWIWRFIINLVYIIMFIAVLMNVATRRWSQWKRRNDRPIMDDVKESFHFEQAKEAVHRFTSGEYSNTAHTTGPNYTRGDESESDHEEDEVASGASDSDHAYEYKYQNKYDRRTEVHPQSTVGMIFSGLLKFFGFLLMLPFICLMITLCCAFGFLIVMSIQGVSIVGFYFLVIGAIIGCGGIITLIERVFCKGGRW